MYLMWKITSFSTYAGIATVTPLSDTIIREQNTTIITCEAFGYPPPTVVWNRVDGILSNRVSVSDSVSVLIGNGNVTRVSVNLTITNASREDTGAYTCSANNSIGSDNSNVTITVECKFIPLRVHKGGECPTYHTSHCAKFNPYILVYICSYKIY